MHTRPIIKYSQVNAHHPSSLYRILKSEELQTSPKHRVAIKRHVLCSGNGHESSKTHCFQPGSYSRRAGGSSSRASVDDLPAVEGQSTPSLPRRFGLALQPRSHRQLADQGGRGLSSRRPFKSTAARRLVASQVIKIASAGLRDERSAPLGELDFLRAELRHPFLTSHEQGLSPGFEGWPKISPRQAPLVKAKSDGLQAVF
jgi:hypothetical protein